MIIFKICLNYTCFLRKDFKGNHKKRIKEKERKKKPKTLLSWGGSEEGEREEVKPVNAKKVPSST